MKNWITAAAVIVAATATAAGPAAAQSGEAAKGQRIFNTQCKSCHTVEKDGAQVTGPNLHGLFGRKGGTNAGYAYSDAMKNSGIVWDEATLTEYNRDPKAKVPGTKMLYNGVKNAGQLADLVAYLKEATK